MQRIIQLQPFSELINLFKDFHSDKVFERPSFINNEEDFYHQLYLVTNELSPENIRAFFRLTDRKPILQGVDRKKQFSYMYDLGSQVISHLCVAEASDCFVQHELIVVDTLPCAVNDVIFWSGEWMVVKEVNYDNKTATTVQIKTNKEFFIDFSFKFGLYDGPHYVIGKSVN